MEARARAVAPWEDRLAAGLRGFGPTGIFAILCILYATWYAPPLAFLMVLVWTRLSRTPWREIGYVLPKRWAVEMIVGLVFGCVLKLLMKAVVMPLLGADPINHAYHSLVGNRAAIPGILLTILVAAVGEETLFRGYLFERLGKALGPSVAAQGAIVLLTSFWFGLNHFVLMGVAGAENAAVFALVFGAIYAVTRRLWLLMFAHFAADFVACAIIYLNMEAKVAHWVFR
jgi:membrane protease YdiL (CAAX protease family)